MSLKIITWQKSHLRKIKTFTNKYKLGIIGKREDD